MLVKYLESMLVKLVMGLYAPFVLLAVAAVVDPILRGRVVSIAFIVSLAVLLAMIITWIIVFRDKDRNLGNMHGLYLFMVITAINPAIQANNSTDVLTFRFIIPIATLFLGLMIFLIGSARVVTDKASLGYSYILSILVTISIVIGGSGVYAVMLNYLQKL